MSEFVFRQTLNAGMILACLALGGPWAAASPRPPSSPVAHFLPEPPPRLVVVLVVDQLRADALSRFRSRLGPRGLVRFMDEGAYFPLAEFAMMQCMTCPGHATLLTGAYPARSGIPANNWYDPRTGRKVYCTDTPGGERAPSVAQLRAPTLGDALKLSGTPGKVVSLSHKDRAAIMMGGRTADAVLWFEQDEFAWTAREGPGRDGALPGWLVAHNGRLARRRGVEYTWAAGPGGSGISAAGRQGFSQTWVLGEEPWAIDSPLGLELLTEVTMAAVDAYELGADASPDLLLVSYSVFDYVGHGFGQHHRRVEEMTVALDEQVARLLAGLGQRVRPEHLLVVLTSDHGVSPTVEYATSLGLPGLRFNERALADALESHLRAAHGVSPTGTWVLAAHEQNFWLVDLPMIRAAAAEWLRDRPEVQWAFTRDDHRRGQLPPEPDRTRILNQYVPGRSGDVVVGLRPFALPDREPALHLTGLAHDRYVPLAFLGAGVRPGIHPAGAQMVDLAPTLAFLMGVLPPALSEGRVLSEALRGVGPRPLEGPRAP